MIFERLRIGDHEVFVRIGRKLYRPFDLSHLMIGRYDNIHRGKIDLLAARIGKELARRTGRLTCGHDIDAMAACLDVFAGYRGVGFDANQIVGWRAGRNAECQTGQEHSAS